MSSIIFWTLTGVVCLSPLPLASNRPLPWSLLSIAVGALLLAWGASRLYAAVATDRAIDGPAADRPSGGGTSNRSIDRHAAVLTVGFTLLMLWYWAQGSPELSGGWSHDAWAEAAAAMGERLPAAISLDPVAGETLFMKLLAYGGILLLALDLGRDRARARMAFGLVSLSGLAYAVYGLGVHFTGAGMVLWFAKDAYPDSVTATFVNRNAYATYAGMTVIAGLALLLSEARRLRGDRITVLRFLRAMSERGSLWLYVAIVAMLMGMVAVALTGSRAGVACLVFALAVFGVCMLIAREITPRTFLIGTAAGAALVVAILSVSGGFLAKRLGTESAPEARAAIFDVARAAAAEEPWFGHGLGGFGPAFNRANDGRAVFETYVDLAHNAYLELAVEGGIPALLLSLALIGSCVGICFSGLLTRGRAASISIAAIAVAALVGAHAMVDFGIQIPAVAANFMLLIGVATAQALVVEQAGRLAAPDAARGDGRWRSPRRGRFGLERPQNADDPVTPPPTLDMPWPQRADPPDLSGRKRNLVPAADAAARPTVSEVLPPERASDGAGSSGDDYESAMARWRAVRPTEERSAPPGPTTRPSRSPTDATDTAIGPTDRVATPPNGPDTPDAARRGARRSPARPNVVHRGQSAMPPESPATGEATAPAGPSTRPASAPASTDGGGDTDRRPPNVVNLPRPPRS